MHYNLTWRFGNRHRPTVAPEKGGITLLFFYAGRRKKFNESSFSCENDVKHDDSWKKANFFRIRQEEKGELSRIGNWHIHTCLLDWNVKDQKEVSRNDKSGID